AVTSMPASVASETALAFMARLGLKANQVDELQKVPMEQVLSALQARSAAPAANSAPAEGARGGGRGRGGAGGGFAASPVVDGKSLPHDVFSPTATTLSANVPLLIGSTETEVTWNVNTDYTVPADDGSLREPVKGTLRTD